MEEFGLLMVQIKFVIQNHNEKVRLTYIPKGVNLSKCYVTELFCIANLLGCFIGEAIEENE